MLDAPTIVPELLREEAERYRRLAENLTDQKDRETVMGYCRELLDRAGDGTERAPLSQKPSRFRIER